MLMSILVMILIVILIVILILILILILTMALILILILILTSAVRRSSDVGFPRCKPNPGSHAKWTLMVRVRVSQP